MICALQSFLSADNKSSSIVNAILSNLSFHSEKLNMLTLYIVDQLFLCVAANLKYKIICIYKCTNSNVKKVDLLFSTYICDTIYYTET